MPGRYARTTPCPRVLDNWALSSPDIEVKASFRLPDSFHGSLSLPTRPLASFNFSSGKLIRWRRRSFLHVRLDGEIESGKGGWKEFARIANHIRE